MHKINYSKVNIIPMNHSNQLNPHTDSIILTAPPAASHHYIKRSSQLNSPLFSLPRSPLSSYSSSSCCTTSTITAPSIKSSLSSHCSHPDQAHKNHIPPSTSSDLHLCAYPATTPARFTQPINNMLSSPAFAPRPRTASHPTDLSHLPIQPIIEKPNLEHFSYNATPAYTLNLPSPQIHLDQAMKAEVVDRFGRAVQFEELIDRDFKTVVIFIRHFRCGYSQRYIRRLSKVANGENQESQKKNQKGGKEATELENWIAANGVKVIIVGNGNHQLIESYKMILNCPFPVYTDLSPDQKVYKLLGMKKVKDLKLQRSSNKDPLLVSVDLQALEKSKTPGFHGGSAVKGAHRRHNEPLMGHGETKIAFFSKVIYNAWRMPWKWSGDPQQLGGEIIFEPIREEKLIKRKPIRNKLLSDLKKSNSIRSNSSLNTTATTIDELDGRSSSTLFRRPSCSIKKGGRPTNNSNLRENLDLIKESAKEIQIQCKFIHQMTSFKDHFSIDELMIQSGIRLTSLIQKY